MDIRELPFKLLMYRSHMPVCLGKYVPGWPNYGLVLAITIYRRLTITADLRS